MGKKGQWWSKKFLFFSSITYEHLTIKFKFSFFFSYTLCARPIIRGTKKNIIFFYFRLGQHLHTNCLYLFRKDIHKYLRKTFVGLMKIIKVYTMAPIENFVCLSQLFSCVFFSIIFCFANGKIYRCERIRECLFCTFQLISVRFDNKNHFRMKN